MSGSNHVLDTLFAGPGDIEALCRSLDWSATPLGPVAAWPQSLRTAIRICLESRTAMAIWAGSEFTLIHNEAYRAVLGSKYPRAMGRPLREVWPEIDDAVDSEFRQCFERGVSTRHEEAAFRLLRDGSEEEDAYFAYSLTPIREDEGRIVGVFNVLEETTGAVRARIEREARYRTLLESIDEGFCVARVTLDESRRPLDLRILEANPIFEMKTGLRDVVGKTVRELVPGIEPLWVEAVGSVAVTGKPTRFEDYAQSLGRWFCVYACPMGDPRERQVAVLFDDVTERRRNERVVRESEERHRILALTMPLGVVHQDRDGTIVSMNPAAVTILGKTPEEFVGSSSVEEEHDTIREDGSPFPGMEHPAMVALRMGQSVRDVLMGVFNPRLGAYRWITVNAVPLFRPGEATPYGVYTIFADITEHKLAEQALRKSESRHAFLLQLADALRPLSDSELVQVQATRVLGEHLDASRVNYAEVDADGDTLYVHACYAAPGVASTVGVHPLDSFGICMADSMRSGRTLALPDTNRVLDLADDARRTYQKMAITAHVTVPLMKEGRLVALLSVHQSTPREWTAEDVALIEETAIRTWDAVERARIEEALRESRAQLEEGDHRKNHFLAVLSHELRNPLTPVKNSLYILDRAVPGGDQAQRAKQVIERQIDQLSHLVDDLLDVTRITRGKVQLHRRRLELNELVERALEDHRDLFERGELQLEMLLAPHPVYIHADRNRIAQVISNLLHNAAKFTPRSGHVKVTVSSDASSRRAVVRIADTGSGMTPELLARLFEPFMQADETLDRTKGGLGLGLALVKGLVQQHGGTVEATSPGLGHGSEFAFRLPLDMADALSEDSEPAPTGTGHPRVLVIEDNVDAASSLCELLELLGHEVAVAYDGPEGIAKARQLCPDIVLCDIGLPGMDGYAVARALRAEEALRGTRLVALTGYALPEDQERSTDAGFEQHVAKPPSLEKLIGLLRGRPRE